MSCIKGLRRTNANLKTKPSNGDLAGDAIRKPIESVMNAEQFKHVGLGRTESHGNITAHLFRKHLPLLPSLLKDDNFKDYHYWKDNNIGASNKPPHHLRSPQ